MDESARLPTDRVQFPGPHRPREPTRKRRLDVYGPTNVRGGDVTIVHRHDDEIPDWLMPEEFGGTRRVDWGFG